MTSSHVLHVPNTPHTVIVGGGISGFSTLIHTIREMGPQNTPHMITLYNKDSESMGGGVAYGQANPEHVTNIPARMLSIYADKPDDLVDWIAENRGMNNLTRPELRHYDLDKLGSDQLVPRGLLQVYAKDRLKEVSDQFPNIDVRLVAAQVTDVEPQQNGFLVTHAQPGLSGRTISSSIHAQNVVLAFGHLEPKSPGFINQTPADIRDDAIIPDIWNHKGAINATLHNPDVRHILVAGTGLSGFDIVKTALAEGYFDRSPDNKITLVSNHGEIYPRMDTSNLQLPVIQRSDLADPPHDINDVPDYVADIFDTYRQQGHPDWAIYWGLKPVIPQLVSESGIAPADLVALARENASLVNVTSIGVGGEGIDPVMMLQAEGKVNIVAARIGDITAGQDDDYNITLTVPGPYYPAPDRDIIVRADKIINAIGMGFDITTSQNPLIQSLTQRGLLQTDPETGVGAAVDDHNHPVGAHGSILNGLYIVGPVTTGQAMIKNGQIGAFTQNVIGLRQHAAEIAADIAGTTIDIRHENTIGTRIIMPSGPNQNIPGLSPVALLRELFISEMDLVSAQAVAPVPGTQAVTSIDPLNLAMTGSLYTFVMTPQQEADLAERQMDVFARRAQNHAANGNDDLADFSLWRAKRAQNRMIESRNDARRLG